MHNEVRSDLEQIIALLKSDKCDWVRLFNQALLAFDEEDFESCSSIILSGCGGMGSLNDIVLGQGMDQHGNFCWKDGYRDLNDTFQLLLGRLYGFARAYPRNHSNK
jgi:hypothetical protein